MTAQDIVGLMFDDSVFGLVAFAHLILAECKKSTEQGGLEETSVVHLLFPQLLWRGSGPLIKEGAIFT